MKFAVAHMSLIDNELIVEIVDATSLKDAIAKHSALQSSDYQNWISGMPAKLEGIKEEFFNSDTLIDVKEVPA